MLRHQDLIARMTLEEKIRLCSGASYWTTEAMPRHGIRSIFLSDGPHGLRKQVTERVDHLGANASLPATCFPTASAVASTWDLDLVRQMGEALGAEAVLQDVNVLLGPGVNMKRNPLCGRNFEYFSEDPYLAGKMAAAWIQGLQSQGVGASLKHFALNNQELYRMSTDVLVDERALREYYLPAFEIAVKEARPATVMCAYNKVEGTYCSDNRRLLTEILREEWGFDGVVVTDWGAMNDRVAAFQAGTDLEMPGSQGRWDREVLEAVRSGRLDEAFIDASVDRLLTLIERTTRGTKASLPPDLFDRHHELARRIAAAGAVLLKNDGPVLPLKAGESLAVIGELARTPRYQGAGSSQVVPTRLDSLLDGLRRYVPGVPFAAGYTLRDLPDQALVDEAVALAQKVHTVILCIGLPPAYEGEGFDRPHMRLPENQVALVEALARANPRIVVVLAGGSAIEMPWADRVQAILHMHLAGQAGGLAAADLLFGKENPSGKLAETYPFRYEDVVSSSYYLKPPKQAAYLESFYCGYRYFATAGVPVRYPFGFGLSYTRFEYSDLQVRRTGEYDVEVTASITNAGEYDGAEVVQLYVAPKTGGAYRPVRELKGFSKIHLKRGETGQVSFRLDRRSFAIYDPARREWVVEAGRYDLEVGASSQDIRLSATIHLQGVEPARTPCSGWYYTLNGVPSKKDFITIHPDYPEYVPQTRGTYDMTSSVREMQETSLLLRLVYRVLKREAVKHLGVRADPEDPAFKMAVESAATTPLRALVLFDPKSLPLALAEFLVEWANGRRLRALGMLLRRRAKRAG